MVNADVGVAVGVVFNVVAGGVHCDGLAVQDDAHAVGVAVDGRHNRVDAGGVELDGEVVFVHFGFAGMHEALGVVAPQALQVEEVVSVVAGVGVEDFLPLFFVVFAVEDIGG